MYEGWIQIQAPLHLPSAPCFEELAKIAIENDSPSPCLHPELSSGYHQIMDEYFSGEQRVTDWDWNPLEPFDVSKGWHPGCSKAPMPRSWQENFSLYRSGGWFHGVTHSTPTKNARRWQQRVTKRSLCPWMLCASALRTGMGCYQNCTNGLSCYICWALRVPWKLTSFFCCKHI